MAKMVFVGNVPFSASEDDVRSLFEEIGTVNEVKMIVDNETGRFRGFGFVDMDDVDADKAMEQLDGKEFGGRTLRVSEARPRGTGRKMQNW